MPTDRAGTGPPDAGVALGLGGGERLFSVPHLVAFVALWAIAQFLIAALHHPEVFHGSQLDPDGYMRLVRVKLLVDSWDWFNGFIPRSNWPFGESLHWTRPLDIMLILLALPFRLFVDMPSALALSGALISPLLNLALCVSAVWVIRPVVPGEERFLAMPAVLVQSGIIGYGTAGRADHHELMALLVVLAIGFWIRALLDPTRGRAALWAGITSGLGMWVSTEMLLSLALLFMSGGLAWVILGDRYLTANRRLAGGVAAAVGVGILVDKPPQAWLTQTFDQISIPHVTLCLLVLAFWIAIPRLVHWIQAQRGNNDSPTLDTSSATRVERCLAGAVGVAVAGLLMWALHSRFFGGPLVDMDPELKRLLLPYTQELQPLLPKHMGGVGRFLLFMGSAFVLFPAAAFWLKGAGELQKRLIWLFFVIWLAVWIPLATAQMRFALYSGIGLALVGVEFLRRAFESIRNHCSGWRRPVARMTLMIGLFMGPILLSGFADVALGTDAAVESGEEGSMCSVPLLTPVLTDKEGLGSRQQVIAVSPNFGPELLYRTPHRILAGPYHRNASGFMALFGILTATDTGRAREIVNQRDVSLILICPPADSWYFGRDSASLYSQLLRGTPPRWIQPIAVPKESSGGFRLFRVVPQSAAPGD